MTVRSLMAWTTVLALMLGGGIAFNRLAERAARLRHEEYERIFLRDAALAESEGRPAEAAQLRAAAAKQRADKLKFRP